MCKTIVVSNLSITDIPENNLNGDSGHRIFTRRVETDLNNGQHEQLVDTNRKSHVVALVVGRSITNAVRVGEKLVGSIDVMKVNESVGIRSGSEPVLIKVPRLKRRGQPEFNATRQWMKWKHT